MRYTAKLIRLFKERQKKRRTSTDARQHGEEMLQLLSSKLQKNLAALRATFEDSSDLVIREFSFGTNKDKEVKAALIFLDGLTNPTIINDSIIKPLMHDNHLLYEEEASDLSDLDLIRNRLLSVGVVKTIYTPNEVIEACLSGNAILMTDGFCQALDIGAKGGEKRAVSEPVSETSVRGPREGLTENLRTNTAMIRRKIKDPSLKIRSAVIGARTHTQVNLLYIDGIVDPVLVDEVERRLKKIDTDASRITPIHHFL